MFLQPSASEEGEEALRRMTLDSAFEARVYAAESLLANPVGFAFDDRGRCYLVETDRRRTSALDIRFFPDWLEEDLALRSVDDRHAFLERNVVDQSDAIESRFRVDRNGDGIFDVRDLAVESDRIRLIEDSDGDGVADRASVFAEGFATPVSGQAAGVLPLEDAVWFSCIPDLWRLEDADGDGIAEERRAVFSGFGVHIGLGGHDLDGPILGPDRRLYFSVGDRGARITREGKVLADLPDRGAVFRCRLDGSDFEVVATGLRNPRDLAFDDFGNLWTVDDNAGSADRSRLIHVVEGADYGWQASYQWFDGEGPWERESLWRTHPGNTGAWILPPVAHASHGPAGLVFYPGTGLSRRFRGHFFLADSPGGIRYFRVEPLGAGFTVPHLPEVLQDNSPERMENKLLWGLHPVDVGFGPGGGLYVADRGEGREKTGKGRIFHLIEKDRTPFGETTEVDRILRGGFRDLSSKNLADLLEHADRRIRLRAQFELARRHDPSQTALEDVIAGALGLDPLKLLQNALEKGEDIRTRLHGLWGLGEILARHRTGSRYLVPYLTDPEAEIRAQTARTLADQGMVGYYSSYGDLLADPHPRVRFFGILWLGKTVRKGFHEVQMQEGSTVLANLRDTAPLLEILRENADSDAWIRHAAVLTLAWIQDVPALVQAAADASRSVRLGAALALRRLESPEIRVFLEDEDPAIVLEAARAIHDLDITEAMPRLASLYDRPELPEPVLRRVINALFRLGKPEDAAFLAAFVENAEMSQALRIEALSALGAWSDPPALDRFLGIWRPVPERDTRSAIVPLRQALPRLFADPSGAVRLAVVEAIVSLGINSENARLRDLALDHLADEEVRLAALDALAGIGGAEFLEVMGAMRRSPVEALRARAVLLQQRLPEEEAIRLHRLDLDNGGPALQRAALAGLGSMSHPEARRLLADWMKRLADGAVPDELVLDILDAARATGHQELLAMVSAHEERSAALDFPDNLRDVLRGGDAEAGERVFSGRRDLECARCHLARPASGVGPDLSGVGARLTREQILRSIVHPDAAITRGYDSITLTLKDGVVRQGVVREESEEAITIVSLEDGTVRVPLEDVARREARLSSMPGGLAEEMTRRELRDLVEYLSTLR